MITIIGAGPAGSYLAYLLAKQNQEVTLIEEHSEVGKPVQCTGIMTPSIEKFVKVKHNVLAKKLSKVIVISKNKKTDIDVGEIVVWRNLFDQQIADMAVDAGAKLILNSKFISIEGKHNVKIKDNSNNKIKTIHSDFIVGADGPSSSVARAAGIKKTNKNYIGMQAKVKLNINQNAFETHFGSRFPNFFGWVVPESEDTVRLGLGALSNPRDHFYKFLESRTGKKNIVCWESGLIPVYDPSQILQKNNVYLVGDAATMVKATTGGGIVPSFKAAHTLAGCILNNKNYNKEFKKSSGRELFLHLCIRKILNRFSDKDYDKLIDLMSQDKIKKILSKYDRDTPIPLAINLLLKEPRFLFRLKAVI